MYDLVLQAVGRTPNGKKIGADKAGVIVGDRGFIPVDVQMRTNVPHIFAIGDIVGQPMLAHKAVHEGHVAAEVAVGRRARALRRPRDPERGLHRPRGGLGRPHRGPGQGAGHRGQEGPVPVDGLRPRHRQRPRRRPDQAAVRREDAPHRRRRHRRHERGRHDRRDRAGHRDGRRRGRHRPHDPPAPDAGRVDRPGRRSGARQLHGPAAAAQEWPERPGPDERVAPLARHRLEIVGSLQPERSAGVVTGLGAEFPVVRLGQPAPVQDGAC